MEAVRAWPTLSLSVLSCPVDNSAAGRRSGLVGKGKVEWRGWGRRLLTKKKKVKACTRQRKLAFLDVQGPSARASWMLIICDQS